MYFNELKQDAFWINNKFDVIFNLELSQRSLVWSHPIR